MPGADRCGCMEAAVERPDVAGRCSCTSSPVEGCMEAAVERPEVATGVRDSDAGVVAGAEVDEVCDPEEAIA